jgi:hypothetical protein
MKEKQRRQSAKLKIEIVMRLFLICSLLKIKHESTPKSDFHGYLIYFSQTISTAKNAKNDAK